MCLRNSYSFFYLLCCYQSFLPFPSHQCFLILHPTQCKQSLFSRKTNAEQPHCERERSSPLLLTHVHARSHAYPLFLDDSRPCHFTQQSPSHGGNVEAMEEEKNDLVISPLQCCQLCTAFHAKSKASGSRGNVWRGSFLRRAKPGEQGNTHPRTQWFFLDSCLFITNPIQSIGKSH